MTQLCVHLKIYPHYRLAAELLAAAEQCQLELLKSICEEKLCSCLEIGNSVNYLVLGDMYQVRLPSYLEKCSNFVFVRRDQRQAFCQAQGHISTSMNFC